MRHDSYDATCGICKTNAGESDSQAVTVFEHDLWIVRQIGPDVGVPGWMMLVTQRHAAGPAHLNDREAASLGPSLRHFERVLEQVTGALRIYTATMNESAPHFHCHMVPRGETMPNDVFGWDVFDLLRATGAGEVSVDTAEVARITEAYRVALAESPPPS
ncbi:MAG: hypothetical protein QGG34_00500 [SAR202 cluster bacterium]|jgi:diadenosine tetraphosphate (Ap4A) HIT family hydrolase|nr:hypothetical protein [SAR202 cluster bacterium]MDP6299827.1 hypothetical protein [SAR202 cluster bacterium]MDP7102562.1 hypothetical protein [SAR202 cluster bacterium]MDP7223892.1 hypothetical protein [SAR202 cluster bacterium]MDP7413252.1 hypothetical protein [SAR202 cluster bacterium]|tara:strand:+ start:6266 stop:6745 length:480 start_codon:yes stop_codon:yes gene_type:complete